MLPPDLDSFPRLTLNDLRRFALGSYQLKQARSYYGEHVRANSAYCIEISNEIIEDLPLILGQNKYLLRARIKSRHVNNRTYYTYLLIAREQERANSLESVIAYYCTVYLLSGKSYSRVLRSYDDRIMVFKLGTFY